MLNLKLISFNLNQAKLEDLPTPGSLLEKLEQGKSITADEVRLAGVPVAKMLIEKALRERTIEDLLKIFRRMSYFSTTLQMKRFIEEKIQACNDPELKKDLGKFNLEKLAALGVRSEEDLEILAEFIISPQRQRLLQGVFSKDCRTGIGLKNFSGLVTYKAYKRPEGVICEEIWIYYDNVEDFIMWKTEKNLA